MLDFDYDFRVEEQPLFISTGVKATDRKAIVRPDENIILSTVSPKYRLIKHKTVIDEANKYVQKLGVPSQIRNSMSKNGASLITEYTFRDKTLSMKVGDVVGLRLYMGNSYNATASVKFRVGAMVLKCTNGMVLPGEHLDFSMRHMGNQEIVFPDVDMVLGTFFDYGKKLDKLQEITMGETELENMREVAIQEGVIAEKVKEAPILGNSAWDLYNQFTYHLTHNESPNALYINKVRRMERVANWMEDMFELGETA